MKNIETVNDLGGLWPAIPTPWEPSGSIASDIVARNVERHASIPMDGIYTTDSDGEFYAVELDDFKTLAAAFARAVEPTGMGAAMGATWFNTQGVIDRIRAAMDCGIGLFHIAYPGWMELSAGDVERFWDDLAAAAPEARWIHYNHPSAQPIMSGVDYARIAKAHPKQFIGTKVSGTNLLELSEILINAPDLAHLTGGDYFTVTSMMMGAKGAYSYWGNTLPRWSRRLVDLCIAEKWGEAMAMQQRLIRWEMLHVAPLRREGYQSGILGKARAALSGFLEDTGIVKPPYQPVRKEVFDRFKAAFDDYWAGES